MSKLKNNTIFKTLALLINTIVLVLLTLTATAQNVKAEEPMTISAPVYQLRIYEIFEHNKRAFHERFRDHAARLMRQHQFNIVAMWEAKSNDKTEFVYLLEWPDEDTMRGRWQSFMADQEWEQIKQVTGSAHGQMVGGIQEKVMYIATYSPPLK